MGNRNDLQRGKQGIQLISNVTALQGRERAKKTDNIQNSLHSVFLVTCGGKSKQKTSRGKKGQAPFSRLLVNAYGNRLDWIFLNQRREEKMVCSEGS